MRSSSSPHQLARYAEDIRIPHPPLWNGAMRETVASVTNRSSPVSPASQLPVSSNNHATCELKLMQSDIQSASRFYSILQLFQTPMVPFVRDWIKRLLFCAIYLLACCVSVTLFLSRHFQEEGREGKEVGTSDKTIAADVLRGWALLRLFRMAWPLLAVNWQRQVPAASLPDFHRDKKRQVSPDIKMNCRLVSFLSLLAAVFVAGFTGEFLSMTFPPLL